MRSIRKHLLQEIAKHNWLESEKHYQDISQEATQQWIRCYYKKWLRHRWLEHVTGQICWDLLNLDFYDIVHKANLHNKSQCNSILRDLEDYKENLDILFVDPTALNILTILKINQWRIPFNLLNSFNNSDNRQQT